MVYVVKFLKTVTGIVFLALLFTHSAIAGQVFVDAAGRSVTLPDHVERVMAAGPPAQVLIYVLAPDKLVGWVKPPNDTDKQFLLPSAANLPAQGRLISKDGSVNADVVSAGKPDLIIDIGDVDARYAANADKVQQQTGVPYVLLDGHFAKTADSLLQAGKLLGVSDRATALADYAFETEAQAKTVGLQLSPDEFPSIYYGRGDDGLETGMQGSINAEMFDAVSAANVASALGSGNLRQISLEQIAQWKPQYIFAETDQFYQSAKQNPTLAGTPAIQSRKLFHAPLSPFGWIDTPPSVNRLLGAKWLLAVLYPDRTHDDIAAEAKRFYELFYGVDISDSQAADFAKTAAPMR